MRKVVPLTILSIGALWKGADWLVTAGTMPSDMAQLWSEHMSDVGWIPIALMLAGAVGTIYVFWPSLWKAIAGGAERDSSGRIENNYGFATANGPVIVHSGAPERNVDGATESYLLQRLEKGVPVTIDNVQGEEPARFAQAIAAFLEASGFSVVGRGTSATNYSGLFAGCSHQPGSPKENIVRVGYRSR